MTAGTYALRRLRARPLRTLLTMMACAILTALVGLLWTIDRSLSSDWSPHEAQRLVVRPRGLGTDGLPIAMAERLRQLPGVEAVTSFDIVSARFRDDRGAAAFQKAAVDPLPYLDVHAEAKVTAEDRKAWAGDPTGAAIAENLARRVGLRRGDRVVLRLNSMPVVLELTVRAIIACPRDSGLYFHRRYLREKLGGLSRTDFFWVMADRPEAVSALTRAIDERFENSPSPTKTDSERQWQLEFLGMLGNVRALMTGIGVVAGLTLVLITSNTLSMSARERRSENALLRVLGFGRLHVAVLLLLESLLYGLGGGLLGSGLTIGLLHLVASGLQSTALAPVAALLALRPDVFTFAAASSLILSVLAAAHPALLAGSGPLADQLRRV
ncbi:MAG: FtsX-like permease family protein [Acidobacteria bacterium]|nr:FtsX-like permease family protein [Acidobacteriota bacterium]